jgi:hypothetical protein
MVELVQPDITCASSSIISPTISPHFPETSSSKITTPLSAHSPNLPAQTSPNSNGYSTYSHNTNGSSKHVNAAPHRHVLMLLDVQKNMVSDPKTRVHSAEQVRSNIWTVLQAARAADPPPLIVHIRNVGDPGEPDAPDTEGFELYFETLPGEYVINKRKNNAFTSVELDELIPKDAEIVVVGMQSDFCVRATCSAALGRGNVVLVRPKSLIFGIES